VLDQIARKAGLAPALADRRPLALVLLAQMREPETYEQLVRNPGLVEEFLSALNMGSQQRETLLATRPELKRVYDDPHPAPPVRNRPRYRLRRCGVNPLGAAGQGQRRGIAGLAGGTMPQHRPCFLIQIN
jgi:hypothetical protein